MSDHPKASEIPTEDEYRAAVERLRTRARERLIKAGKSKTGGTLPPAGELPEDKDDMDIVRRYGQARGVVVDDRERPAADAKKR